jgi:hypothetical protein
MTDGTVRTGSIHVHIVNEDMKMIAKETYYLDENGQITTDAEDGVRRIARKGSTINPAVAKIYKFVDGEPVKKKKLGDGEPVKPFSMSDVSSGDPKAVKPPAAKTK